MGLLQLFLLSAPFVAEVTVSYLSRFPATEPQDGAMELKAVLWGICFIDDIEREYETKEPSRNLFH